MQNTFKGNGYSLKKSHFYLPLFNKNNELHKKIVTLSKRASTITSSDEITKIQSELSDLYLKLCENEL